MFFDTGSKKPMPKLIVFNLKTKKLFTSTTQRSEQFLFKQVTKKLHKTKTKNKKTKPSKSGSGNFKRRKKRLNWVAVLVKNG
jgi:hypothetical protein